MKLTSSCFEDNGTIPSECAFGVIDPQTRIALSSNINPDLEWSNIPVATKSLALICYDPDVPAALEDINKENRLIPVSAERVDFYHWVLVDIAPSLGRIAKGQFSNAIIPRGKPGPDGPNGTRQGLNGYTNWFHDDDNMSGNYFGYDGPCPPWNDELSHRYIFKLYALDVAKCPVTGIFSAPAVLKAIRSHILTTAELTGRYTLNPDISDPVTP